MTQRTPLGYPFFCNCNDLMSPWNRTYCFDAIGLYTLWRSARSTIHLSPKDLRISKWSHTGKNGSKHRCYLYLLLKFDFMQNKSKETLKKSKSPILQYKSGSPAQKWPKIAKKRITQSWFAHFLYVWYFLDGIWWIPMSMRYAAYFRQRHLSPYL